MAQSGDWITPQLCGKPYLIKPVLYHWLGAAAFRFFGETEIAGRLPQAAAGILTVLALALFAARVSDRRLGWLAGAALATCPGFATAARVAGMDVLLTATTTLSLLCFYLGYRESARRRCWFMAAGAAAGLGMIAKGPLGLLVPALVVSAFLLVMMEPAIALSRPAILGGALSLAVASIWYLPVWIRHGARFSRMFWVENNLARLSEPVSGHSGPPTYYLPIFVLAFLPWSIPFLFLSIRSVLRWVRRAAGSPRPRTDPLSVYLWIWFLAPFVFFSAIATKLPGYLLPVFPAAALLVARGWDPSDRGFRVAAALGVTSLPGVALAVPFLLQHRYGIPPQRIWLFPLVSFAFSAAAVFSALTARGRARPLAWVAASAIFVLGLVRFAILPAGPYESMKEMTGLLMARLDAGYPVALAGGHLKGTLFYTDCLIPNPRDINDLPRPVPGRPLFCLVKDRFRSELEEWARRGGFLVHEVSRRGPLTLVGVTAAESR